MTPEAILRSDVLDIIFENRNKQYGAYTLRREYNRRLIMALMIMLMAVLLLILSSFYKKPGPDVFFVSPEIAIDSIAPEKPIQEKPKPKEVIQKPVATV